VINNVAPTSVDMIRSCIRLFEDCLQIPTRLDEYSFTCQLESPIVTMSGSLVILHLAVMLGVCPIGKLVSILGLLYLW
jgi:hypothetical protein